MSRSLPTVFVVDDDTPVRTASCLAALGGAPGRDLGRRRNSSMPTPMTGRAVSCSTCACPAWRA
jgi:hypothetical protein